MTDTLEKYKELFHQYAEELDEAVTFEEERIEGVRGRLVGEGKSEEEVEKVIRKRCDPLCCSGRVIAVFRKYWLKCHELNVLNEESQTDLYVNPKDFTVDWLTTDGDPYDLFAIIDDMPYYPIGVDENGDYC